MKPIWLCLILLGIIALLIIIPHQYIKTSVEKMNTHLDLLDKEIQTDNWAKAEKLFNNATKEWDKCSPKFEMVIEHEEVDGVERTLRQLRFYVKEKESAEARAILGELDFLVNHLKTSDRLSLENIF
ncbi:MAG: DUF4363 family protein [Eubacteriales bacterium]|nr:DUF4363 family protein [Eubacteriales bacterium]